MTPWLLWLLWLGVTIVGLAWAGWTGHFPFGFASPTNQGAVTLGSALVGAAFGAASGAGVAVAQWLVLRWALRISARWILATLAGIALMHALGDPLGDTGRVPVMSLEFGLVAAVGGTVIGVLQYPVLRPYLSRAQWWIPASTASWALGVMAGLAPVAATGMDRWANREAHMLAGAVAGVFVGLMTGALLVYLRLHHAPRRTGQPALDQGSVNPTRQSRRMTDDNG